MYLEDIYIWTNRYPSTAVIATNLYLRMKNCRNSIENKNEYVSVGKVISKCKALNFVNMCKMIKPNNKEIITKLYIIYNIILVQR